MTRDPRSIHSKHSWWRNSRSRRKRKRNAPFPAPRAEAASRAIIPITLVFFAESIKFSRYYSATKVFLLLLIFIFLPDILAFSTSLFLQVEFSMMADRHEHSRSPVGHRSSRDGRLSGNRHVPRLHRVSPVRASGSSRHCPLSRECRVVVEELRHVRDLVSSFMHQAKKRVFLFTIICTTNIVQIIVNKNTLFLA